MIILYIIIIIIVYIKVLLVKKVCAAVGWAHNTYKCCASRVLIIHRFKFNFMNFFKKSNKTFH